MDPQKKQPEKNAQDWVRQLRFSNDVNLSTVGVDTDKVTPQLMLASSKKLLKISRGQEQGDQKDSLRYQTFYGPVEYFAERIQKDGGSVARSLLWKATNKGNVDFIGSGSLQPHVSSVFHQLNLSQFVDNSSPMDGIDNAMKVTRIGEGGISSGDSAPIEMRLVQPSYYGFIGSARTAQKSPGLTGYMAKNVMRGTDGKLYQNMINMKTGKLEPVSSQKAASSIVTTDEYLNTDDKYVYAMGGPRGVRIVKKSDVDYILPHSDDAYSLAANYVPMFSGIKAMRLLMGCHHPNTPILIIDQQGCTDIVPAKRLSRIEGTFYVVGCDSKGNDALYKVRNIVPRIPAKGSSFIKVVTSSGRVLTTSDCHKWAIYKDNKFQLLYADELIQGMQVPRTLFSSVPVRNTTVMGVPVDTDICVLLGRICDSLTVRSQTYKFTYLPEQKEEIKAALDKLNVLKYSFYIHKGQPSVSIKDPVFLDWMEEHVGFVPEKKRIPKCILSVGKGLTSVFLASFFSSLTNVAQDCMGDSWLLDLPNGQMRDGLAFLLSKIYTDTNFKDSGKEGKIHRALQLVPAEAGVGDICLDTIVSVTKVAPPATMIDIDCDDNVYATANGIITHNSKYGSQAIPLKQREAPLVRALDSQSGQDMPTRIGRLLGTQWAPKPGMVKAVRKDRIDMLYDDGTKGSIYLYENFPANAKGWLSNYVKVKAGDKVGKGQLLATSNYTDENGVAATGRNLRIGYMSYHGGTYEDACAISESAAKKMAATVMYKTGMDKDKSIRTSRSLYNTWKPGAFSKQQMDKLDDDGVVQVGQTLNPGDPMILGIRTTQPSPGTLGKRILTDVTQKWEHSSPGVVTDVVNTRSGIKVYAKVDMPLEVGSKITGFQGSKGTVSQIIPDQRMPRDSKGRPLELLFDPLGIVSRTNPSQMMQAGLGKVAAKTGKPIVMPQFMPKGQSRIQYVKKMMKDNNVPWKEDVYDPQSGRTVKNVFTGVAYFMPLKHYAQAKMSARGTAGYSQDQTPTRGGYQGCFIGSQKVITQQGQLCIGDIYDNKMDCKVLSYDKPRHKWVYNKITDWFRFKSPVSQIMHITMEDGTQLFPTKNHKMYCGDNTTVLAGELKQGDYLAGPTNKKIKSIQTYNTSQQQVYVYDFTVDETHNYCLSGGIKVSNSKGIGSLQAAALVGHDAFSFLIEDAKLIRGQSNADFWRSIRTGQIPVVPGEPLVHKKFFNHLKASGLNVKRTTQGMSLFALSNKDVNQMAGPRQLKTTDTYQHKNFAPIAGGLFGTDVFGEQGNNWGYIQLDSPLPNPVMEQPLARLLNITDSQFQAVIQGKETVNGMSNASDMKKVLAGMDLQKETDKALAQMKDARPSKKDAALKRYVAIARMRDSGITPDQYMLDRIPVLPPKFRPITSHGDLTMVADSNYLYAQLLNARDDMREAKDAGLPQQMLQQAQAGIYRKWKQLTGLYDPSDIKLKNKNVKGLLKWALGSSPKQSAYARKVLGSVVDTVGRGVIVPSTKIKLNQVGMPVEMAWNVYQPFVVRKLVQRNYSPVEAMKLVKRRDPGALDALKEAMSERPVVLNRAPSLHKLSLIGLEPKLVSGSAILTNPSIVVPLAADYDGNCIDYDSEIYLRISKSAFAFFEDLCILSLNNVKQGKSPESLEVQTMRVDAKTNVTAAIVNKSTGDYVYMSTKIGDMPRVGTPTKDRNGADMYKMPEGVQVVACDPVTGERGFYDVEAITVENNCPTVKVCTGSREVIISTNESMAVFDQVEGRLTKVKPEDLDGRLVPVLKKDPMPFGTYGTRDIGWVLGSLISDGWVNGKVVGYSKLEDRKRAEVLRILRECEPNFTCHEYREKPRAGRNKLGESCKIHMHGKDLADWVRSFEILNTEEPFTMKSACYKQISRNVLDQGSEEFLWGLLSGLLDGDGTIVINMATGKPRFTVRYSTSSKFLRDSFGRLLYKLGIRYSVTTTAPRGFSNEAYTIMPSTIDLYANLDKLSCIGEKELEMIARWKELAPVYEDKKDQVPVSDEEWELLYNVCTQKSSNGLYSALMKRGKTRSAMRSGFYKFDEYIKAYIPSLYKRVHEVNTLWCPAEVVADTGNRQVFDLMVKDAKVFAANNGFIVWDTVNLHVPVSKAGVKDVRQKMMPEQNLISIRKKKILYAPQKAYAQGLYVATRMDDSQPVQTFETLKDARQAYAKGIIDVDTPIVIKEQSSGTKS